VNLDPWAMRPATLSRLIASLGRDADLILCEGVMGLFDGIDARGTGSTADLAQRTGWPVVLIVDVRGQAASAAALVAGFARHRRDVQIAGVIFNRVGGASHLATLRDAVALHVPEIPVLGAVPRDAALAMPERHLGLVQARERADLDAFLDSAAQRIAAGIDLDRFQALARPALIPDHAAAPALQPLGQRIALASDDAFAFAYPALLDSWRAQGAEIVPFSPLQDEGPATDCDAVYLPGGYPELHAGRLAANTNFKRGLSETTARGATIFGECGGYMVLGEGLVDDQGARHAMAGLLPLETSFAARRLHLGYRELALAADTPLGRAGARFRGHEFHYASITHEGPGRPLFASADAAGNSLGPAGRNAGIVMGSFIHLIDCM
jgi:cobyrinic acid a,c-diamide synthase